MLERFPSRIRTAAIVAFASAVAVAAVTGCGADDGRTVVVRHPAVPAPTFLDLGDEGPSVGDVRIWHFDAVSGDGEDVRTDWTMVTTAVDTPETGIETRMSKGVFTFGDGDFLILEGVAPYPASGAVLAEDSTTVRVIVGGTGRFDGAGGAVESTRFADGTWEHVFRIR
jgi:hypothetical protein